MSNFGILLRNHREACRDPIFPSRKLSQEKFGALLGSELGMRGYSGAAVSDWERGKSKINADERLVLVTMIKVLHDHGGLQTVELANLLLEAGNYRALDEDEALKIFGDTLTGLNSEPPAYGDENPVTGMFLSFTDMFSISKGELQEILIKSKEGPDPFWPRVLAALMRKTADRFSLSITSLLWIAVWLLAVLLIDPSLRLPFANRESALRAMNMYIAGSMAVPLLIGLFVNTKDSEYWQQQDGLNSFLLRLYTYQGAGIGFNVGYFLVFPLGLVRHYLGFDPTVWTGLLAATIGVVLGNMGARVVPHNLWLAYKRLAWKDGGIFFVVALMGPLWGWFFLEYYSILLTPLLGIVVILLALAMVVLIGRQSSKKQAA